MRYKWVNLFETIKEHCGIGIIDFDDKSYENDGSRLEFYDSIVSNVHLSCGRVIFATERQGVIFSYQLFVGSDDNKIYPYTCDGSKDSSCAIEDDCFVRALFDEIFSYCLGENEFDKYDFIECDD